MTNNHLSNSTFFNCAGLEFDLELGAIKNTLGESQRLSPVNLKLLAYLLRHQGELVSRTELFDAVWSNQIVSDDVLTRAISDIRTQLAKLDDSTKFIETLPKRGYRWVFDVVPASVQNSTIDPGDPVSIAESRESSVAGLHLGRLLGRFGINLLIYFIPAVFVAVAIMWWLGQASTNQIKIAVLPTLADHPQTARIAKTLDENILLLLRKNSNLKLLSKSAIGSRPQNPFPYFSTEFGAKWVLESQVMDSDGVLELELSLVDARTGLELRNIYIEFTDNTDMLAKLAKKLETDFLVEDIGY